jgi:hypothetical protein
MIHRFKYLKYALALVLVFIGSKIFLVGIIGKIPAVISLSVTFGLIAVLGCAAPIVAVEDQRVAELELPGPWAQRVLDGLATAYAMAGRHARARLGPLAGPGWRLAHAAVVGLMALIVVMPIPFGNVLPALALTLIGLGLVFRDGLAVLLGLLGAGVALGATAGLVLLAWTWGSDWVGHWAGNWAGS